MPTPSLKDLYQDIQGDRRRVALGFTADIPTANALLHNPAAYDDELGECLRRWCQDQQPCQFGKAAARNNRIHFCVLREPAIDKWSDDEIKDAIAESKRLWKQRAAFDPGRAAHSFVLVLASPRLAFAAPDASLRAFADRALQLTGWAVDTSGNRRRNTVSSDYLYLRNPNDNQFYGFQFNIDFFACAGDRRWWHDHRFPGGIAFTANSTGHMRSYRDWYEGAANVGEWAIKQAMLTIANSAPATQFRDPPVGANIANTPIDEGRVTWLRPLTPDKRPFLTNIPNPLTTVPKQLIDKDWTRYEGFLHTDHAVREEFFHARDTPPTQAKPYLMDFTYLYDTTQADFIELTAGKPFTESQIHEEIGDPSTWTHRHTDVATSRSEADEVLIAEQFAACETWQTPPWHRHVDA